MMQEKLMLTNRLNQLATLFCNCTLGELAICYGVSGMVWLVLSLVFCAFWAKNVLITALIIAIPLAALTGYLISKKLGCIKLGKPRGFHEQLILKKLQQFGVTPQIYLLKSQKWSVDRRLS